MTTDADLAPGSDRSGLDRRTLIKRAAIVGAAAWTAPVIIDSLASPAGALTGTCTFASWDLNPAPTCTYQKPSNANDCLATNTCNGTTPSTAATPTSFCTAQGGIQISCSQTYVLTLTIPAGCSCVFVSGASKGTGTGACLKTDAVNPVGTSAIIAGDGKSMTFDWGAGSNTQAARVNFYISC